MELLDEPLVALLRDGDLSAMESVYNTLFGDVFAYSRSYVIDTEQAWEITQDSFLYLWEKRRNLRGNSNLKGYLLRIARNKSLNWIQHRRTERNFSDYIQSRELSINYEALKDKTAELVLTHELSEIIGKTLRELPEPYREVFELSRNEELSYSEIADMLGVSVKTVEYRMMRALAIFKKALLPYYPLIIFLIISYIK